MAWYKGNKPTKVERYLHERRLDDAHELVQDWMDRDLIALRCDQWEQVHETMAEEIRELIETGRYIAL